MNKIKINKINASIGGKKTAKILTDDQKEQRARNGGMGTLKRYGRDYFSAIAKMRKK